MRRESTFKPSIFRNLSTFEGSLIGNHCVNSTLLTWNKNGLVSKNASVLALKFSASIVILDVAQ
jgi:hypothetical protein